MKGPTDPRFKDASDDHPLMDTPQIGPEFLPADRAEDRDLRECRAMVEAAGVPKVELAELTGMSKADVTTACDFTNLSYYPHALESKDFKTEDDLKAQGYNIEYVVDPITQNQAVIATRGDEFIIGFRGTSNRKNVLTDLSVALNTSSFMTGRVHGGFYEAFRGIWPGVMEKLATHLHSTGKAVEDLKFVVTGHSLGGALAKIAALYLHKEVGVLSQDMKVVTFGDPRAFDPVQAQEYDKALCSSTVRIVQEGDPITVVSPGHWGYKHVGLTVDVPRGTHPRHALVGYGDAVQQLPKDLVFSTRKVSMYSPVALLQAANVKLGVLHKAFKSAVAGAGSFSKSMAPIVDKLPRRKPPALSRAKTR